MTLGETLTNLRKSKGLSQEQLADELGLTRQTISKWELNQSAPDINYLIRLSNFFGVTTDHLIKGEQPCTTTEQLNEQISQSIHPKSSGYKWYAFLGAAIMGISLIGISAFIICSAVDPWIVSIDGREFRGILGYLLGTKTLWFFIILFVVFISGGLTSAYGIIKSIKNK